MDVILTAALIYVLYIAIMSMPSKDLCSSPYPTWIQNAEHHLQQSGRFFREKFAYVAVAISLAAPFLIVPAHNSRIVAKEDATIAIVASTAAGALASVFLLWKKYKNNSWLQGLFVPFQISIAAISYLFFSIGGAIADEEIQRLVAINPEELSTARALLAGLFAMWLWVVFFSCLLFAFGIFHLFSMLYFWPIASSREARGQASSAHVMLATEQETASTNEDKAGAARHQNASDAELNKDVVIMAGLFSASLSLLSITASDWHTEKLRAAIPMFVLSTSFFGPTDKLKKCMAPGYATIRLIGDGDRAVISDGKKQFKVVPCDPHQSSSHRESPQ